jgi:hypothetical protein
MWDNKVSYISAQHRCGGDGRENRARICKRLWRLGIDSEQSIPPSYLTWRAGTKNRVVVLARQAENRFLGSLKGLQIRAQAQSGQNLPLFYIRSFLGTVQSFPS